MHAASSLAASLEADSFCTRKSSNSSPRIFFNAGVASKWPLKAKCEAQEHALAKPNGRRPSQATMRQHNV